MAAPKAMIARRIVRTISRRGLRIRRYPCLVRQHLPAAVLETVGVLRPADNRADGGPGGMRFGICLTQGQACRQAPRIGSELNLKSHDATRNREIATMSTRPSRPLTVLGIAGSLRRGSYNRGLIRAAIELAPAGISVVPYDLIDIPMYNGDVEAEGDPAPVADFKRAIGTADALLLATPEYNHCVPGVLK